MVDLVITDYNMPEMDGRALIEYIRQQSWQSTVPILGHQRIRHEPPGRCRAGRRFGDLRQAPRAAG